MLYKEATTGAAVPCVNGHAAGYGCQQVELLAYLPAAAIGGKDSVILGDARDTLVVKLNDMWGWTDAKTQREFALVGLVDGTAFVEVTNPIHPTYLGKLPLSDSAKPSGWRGIIAHQGWFTENQWYFFLGDEGGEGEDG